MKHAALVLLALWASCTLQEAPDGAFVRDDLGPVYLLQRPATRSWATFVQTHAPWHLDRMDSRELDGLYGCYGSCGEGTQLYVLDTGCHDEDPFCLCAFDALGQDCRSEAGLHGSQVAGLVRAASPLSTVRSVRLFDGERSDISGGLDYVLAAADSGAVVVMTFYVPSYSSRICSRTDSLLAHGVTLFAAAGNFAQPASHTGSPQNCSGVYTVGAYDRYYQRAVWSAFEATVYAPGEDVCAWSPWGESCTSGTSLAAPLAAGAYALRGSLERMTTTGYMPTERAVFIPHLWSAE